MKYPTVLMYETYNSLTGESSVFPGVFDMDIESMTRFYKSKGGSTFVKFKDEEGYMKFLCSFWDFLSMVKDKNNLDISIEDLVKLYDKDSLDDLLLNGI